MRKIAYLILTFLCFASFSFSQGEIEAYKFSNRGLYGTARAMSMGNAFGALGGDITGVSINPAGIGVYRSSEVVGTMGFFHNTNKAGDISKSINNFDLHNMGYIGYFPLRNEIMPMINFGFTFNKQNIFNSYTNALGNAQSTMLDYIADRSFGVNPKNLQLGDNLPDPFLDQPWLTVLGYNSWLINVREDANGNFIYSPLNTKGETAFQEIRHKDKGYIDTYDFTVGTTLGNVLNVGISLSVTDIYNYMRSDFLEDYNNGGYTLNNEITTTGSGASAKFGLIYRPINAFRIGVAYHTPTWYSLTELYRASINDDMGAYVSDPLYESDVTRSATFTNYYDLRNPDKWVISAATVLGNSFIVSADYEMSDYRKMKLSVPSGNSDRELYDMDNEFIRTDFKTASTIKVGMEYRFTPQCSGRLGYAWVENPYNSDFSQEGGDAAVSGSNTIFKIEGDNNYFTGGIGYRFNRNFYADLAVVYQTREDQLYPFPNLYTYNGDTRDQLVIDASPFTLKNNSVKALLTLGYKF